VLVIQKIQHGVPAIDTKYLSIININYYVYYNAAMQIAKAIETTPTTTPVTPLFENLTPDDLVPEVAVAVLLELACVLILPVTDLLPSVGAVTIKVLGVGTLIDPVNDPVG
jgi:hypothetical protein